MRQAVLSPGHFVNTFRGIEIFLTQSQLAGVGLVVAFGLVALLARREGVRLREALASIGLVTASAVIGARVWSLAAAALAGDPLGPLLIGYSTGGAFVGAAVVLLAYRHAFGVEPFRSLLDLLTPPALVGLALARLGCALEGCHLGLPTDGDLGVTYAHLEGAFHPFGAYLALPTLAVAAAALVAPVERPGMRGAVALVGYGVVRFVAEFWRDPAGLASLGVIQTGHIVALAVLAAGLGLMVLVARDG